MSQIDVKNAFDEQKARKALANFFCSAALPPQTVEGLYFKKFQNYLNPQFQPSVDDIGHDCLETYEEVKAKVKQVLRNLDGQISLSVDILRYEKRYEYPQDYLCLTAHFIDDNWKLKSWILRFSRVLDESSDLPHEVILKSLKDWDIEEKISTITMVNDNFYCETSEIVKDHIQGKRELPLNGRLFQVRCCGDIVSLMVQAAYKYITNTIDKVRELYSFGKSLPLWYLTNGSLKEALELESRGEFSSQDVQENYEVPSAEEWEKVRGICELVESIYEVTEVLFEAKYPTANVYLYHLRELQAILIQKATSADEFIRSVAKKMMKKFDKYWKDMYLVLAITMVMDPRFKMKYLEFSSSKFDDSDGIPGVATVLEAIRSLFNDYVIQFPGRDDILSDSTSSELESNKNVEEEHCNLDDRYKLLPDYLQFIQSSRGIPKSELDWYLEEPVLPWTHEFNALRWWRNSSSKFPTLSRMARDLLAIPVSIATSFEAFYTEPREADERLITSGSGPDLMNALMCTRSWYPWP